MYYERKYQAFDQVRQSRECRSQDTGDVRVKMQDFGVLMNIMRNVQTLPIEWDGAPRMYGALEVFSTKNDHEGVG